MNNSRSVKALFKDNSRKLNETSRTTYSRRRVVFFRTDLELISICEKDLFCNIGTCELLDPVSFAVHEYTILSSPPQINPT